RCIMPGSWRPAPPRRPPPFPCTTLFRSEPRGVVEKPTNEREPQTWNQADAEKRHVDAERHDNARHDQCPTNEMPDQGGAARRLRSEEHTSELQSRENLVCRLLLEKENAV